MTQSARETLQDCRDALADFEYGAQGSKWRRWWIMNLTLLRAVGHVLEKVDGARSPQHAAVISKCWKELQAAKVPIFEFIEGERNNVVKAYKLGATQIISVPISVVGKPRAMPTATYTYVMASDGPFGGMDQRDVIALAIKFWAQYLDQVDAELGTGSKQPA